jgi:hypothetical protein
VRSAGLRSTPDGQCHPRHRSAPLGRRRRPLRRQRSHRSDSKVHREIMLGVCHPSGLVLVAAGPLHRVDPTMRLRHQQCYHGRETLPADQQVSAVVATCIRRFTREARALAHLTASGAAGAGIVKVVTFFQSPWSTATQAGVPVGRKVVSFRTVATILHPDTRCTVSSRQALPAQPRLRPYHPGPIASTLNIEGEIRIWRRLTPILLRYIEVVGATHARRGIVDSNEEASRTGQK